MHGFLNLNKPPAFTSHDCVAKVRRLLKLKRVGHAGTLDPAATGVLPIALGRATRLLQFLRQDKAYRAVIRLGVSTTTDDLEGAVLSAQSAAHLELEWVQAALQQFKGPIQQIPPNYSAVQVQGKRLYDLARTGATIAVQPRLVEVFRLEVLDWRPGEFPEVEVAIACGPGTYIRAIARDLGQTLQVGGTLATLLRTTSSGFDLGDSLSLTDLEVQCQQGTFQPVAPESALGHLEKITLPDSLALRWCQGQGIIVEDALANGLDDTPQFLDSAFRVHHESDRFLGIGSYSLAETAVLLRPKIVFAQDIP